MQQSMLTKPILYKLFPIGTEVVTKPFNASDTIHKTNMTRHIQNNKHIIISLHMIELKNLLYKTMVLAMKGISISYF